MPGPAENSGEVRLRSPPPGAVRLLGGGRQEISKQTTEQDTFRQCSEEGKWVDEGGNNSVEATSVRWSARASLRKAPEDKEVASRDAEWA